MEESSNGKIRNLSKIEYSLFSIFLYADKVWFSDEKVRKAGATIQDGLGLSDHTSKWNMDAYLAVDKEVPGAENTTLGGKFLSKVYPEMNKYINSKGYKKDK